MVLIRRRARCSTGSLREGYVDTVVLYFRMQPLLLGLSIREETPQHPPLPLTEGLVLELDLGSGSERGAREE